MSSELAIDLRHVAKTYRGRVRALQGVELHVRRGEIFGLLGPNGAGKSTLVKIMMTVVRPSRAEGTVLGQPIGDKHALMRVGYLPESHRFPRYLTGRQTLEFFAAMAKVDRATARRRAGELLHVVGMSAWGGKRISTYSKGMLQRIGIAQALMNDPELILLDEPTDGVDPIGRREIRDLMLRLRDQGKTIFLNSHLLSELEMICSRVAIMVRGMVVRQGTVEELTRQQQRYEIELALPDPVAARQPLLETLRKGGIVLSERRGLPPATMPVLHHSSSMPPPINGAVVIVDEGAMPAGAWVEMQAPILRIGTAEAQAVQPLLDLLRQGGFIIRRLTPVRQSLEELFMQAVIDPQSGQPLAPGAGPAPVPRPPRPDPALVLQAGGTR